MDPTDDVYGRAPSHPPMRIGDWLADPSTHVLTHGTAVVRIEPKVMDVLVTLAERVGRVVSREELLAAAWPGVVVGEEAVTQSIIKLRRALGDSSRKPAYIETISKRGYRLIAPVRPAATPQPPRAAPWGTRAIRPAAWLAVAGALAALLGGGLYLARGGSSTGTEADPGPAAPLTIAVAPFESLGADRDQTYLARGISDALVTDLSRASALRVIREAPTGTQRSAGNGARYRISGSVERDADTLRLNVYLADTSTHQELWSSRFERSFGDLFAVQDEMTAQLAAVLPATLSDMERRRIARRYTTSIDAYDTFLRAQALFLARGPGENEQARALYRKALEQDSHFARAYAGLAMTYAMDARLRGSSASAQALQRASELAETARSIDPDEPEVYWALGFVHAQNRRHAEAIAALQRAIKLDPSFADAYALLGGIYTYLGTPARSVPLLRTAMRLNPGSGYLYFLLLGRAYLFEQDTEQALINLRAAVMRNPADIETRVYLAAALVAAEDPGSARWEADEIRALDPQFSLRDWLASYPLTDDAQGHKLSALLVQAGL